MAKNVLLGQGRINASPFSGKVLCAACGDFFSPKTWHSNDIYKRRAWQCNGKYRTRGGNKCKTPHLSEAQLQLAFVDAFNQVVTDRERYVDALEPVLEMLTNTTDLEAEAEVLGERCADLSTRYEAVKKRLDNVAAERQSRMARRADIPRFIDTVR